MSAIAEPVIPGRDALPVCLGRENPNRLVSLLEIMKQFKAADFCRRVANFGMCEAAFWSNVTGLEQWAERDIDFAAQIIHAANDCHDVGMQRTWEEIDRLNTALGSNATPEQSRMAARLLINLLISELAKRKFLYIPESLGDYVDNDALFGQPVNDSFPSAARDIREAGNCLAADCGTGCVFHLMRAAEVSLRSLATDRGVSYPDGSVSTKQIGDLLGALDGKMSDLRKADARLWPSKDVKDAQIKFYHTAIAEVRDFNEAWRKSMAHGYEGSFYDSLYAESILNHVRTFMQTIAPKISEATVTPTYWLTA